MSVVTYLDGAFVRRVEGYVALIRDDAGAITDVVVETDGAAFTIPIRLVVGVES